MLIEAWLKIKNLSKIVDTYEFPLTCAKWRLNFLERDELTEFAATFQEINGHVKEILELDKSSILGWNHNLSMSG